MNLIRTVAVAVAFAAPTLAQAQGGVNVSPFGGDGWAAVGLVGAVATVGAGVAAGSYGTWHVVRGTRSAGLIPVGVQGTVGVVGSVALLYVGLKNNLRDSTIIGAGLLALSLWNLTMPLVALVRGGQTNSQQKAERSRIAPVFLSGRTASGTGKRWSGLGIELAL